MRAIKPLSIAIILCQTSGKKGPENEPMSRPIGASFAFALKWGVRAGFAAATRAAGCPLSSMTDARMSTASGLGMVLTLAAGLSLTAARAGPLSPADKYVECVEGAASESASRHVGDVEVARSPVPAKVLSVLAGDDVLRACGSLANAADDDDIVKARSGAYDAMNAAAENALVEQPPQRQPPPPGSDDYAHGVKLAPGAQSWLSPECRALLDNEHFTAPGSCAEAVREANSREKVDEQAKEKEMAAAPSVRYCLGLEYKTMPEKTESIVNEALGRIQGIPSAAAA
jgi:hypothetical protein